MCFTVHIILKICYKHSRDLRRDTCLAPEGFKRSICGPRLKKVVHQSFILTCRACLLKFLSSKTVFISELSGERRQQRHLATPDATTHTHTQTLTQNLTLTLTQI